MTSTARLFVGARLREAREARGHSTAELATKLRVTRQAVSQFEAGVAVPRPEIMHKIVSELRVQPHFFWRPDDEDHRSTVFYRSLAAATRTQRLSAERRYGWLRRITRWLRQFVELPRVSFPLPASSSDPSQITEEDIERVASEMRRFWGLGDGPIRNMTGLVESHGAIVSRIYLRSAHLGCLLGVAERR